MKPTLQHSDQVVAHVVAWHNRHPLAQRITAEQVHSVGVVSLPYAVRGARVLPLQPPPGEPAPAPPDETVVDAAAIAAAPDPLPAAPVAPPLEPRPEVEAESAADADTEVAIEAVVEFEPEAAELDPTPAADAPADVEASADAPAEAPIEAPTEAPPEALAEAPGEQPGEDPGEQPSEDSGNAPAAAPAESVVRADPPPAAPAAEPVAAVAAVGVRPALPDRPSDLPPRPRAWHPLTWWERLRGRLPFRALFSEDFMAPLHLRRVRPWVAQHGVGQRPLEPMAPQRVIVLDAALRRPDDTATEVDLHVITAAIGVDDGRHRLLLAPNGAVLGKRRWSRPRLAAAAGSAGAVLALVGGTWVWQAGARDDPALARQAAASAPGVAVAASAAASASTVAVAASAAAIAPAPAAASVPASAPSMVAEAASAAGVAEAVSAAGVAKPASAAVVTAHAAPAPHPASAPAEAASAPEPAATPLAEAPRHVNPRRGRIDLPPLVPRLDDAERQELRLSSRELRQEPAVLPDAKAWALVTAPLVDRRQSERVAAQLQAIALMQPVPMRAELMPAGKGWRAVFWPFPTAQDAEKVRLALADKGLRTEVLEF